MYKDTDLAWAAGIVDGEGWIGECWNNEYYRFNLAISQSSENGIPEILTRFHDIFKLGAICKRRVSKSLKHKQMWQYLVTNDSARKVLRLIWPYLGTVKREQTIKAGFTPPPELLIVV